jgi:hypothetical protein
MVLIVILRKCDQITPKLRFGDTAQLASVAQRFDEQGEGGRGLTAARVVEVVA